jgi:hypothetical protein
MAYCDFLMPSIRRNYAIETSTDRRWLARMRLRRKIEEACMPRHLLKLVALAAVFSVGPAVASQVEAAKAAPHHWDCPKKRAQAAAAAALRTPQQAKGGSTITLSDRVPDGSIFDLGWRHGIFTP